MEGNYKVCIYEQSISAGAKICVLLAHESIEYPSNIMHYAVSQVVAYHMYNEMIDASLRRPYLRLVFIGDINKLKWSKYKDSSDCESVEFTLMDNNQFAGKVVFMRGGLYNNDPNTYMSNMVQDYISNLDKNVYGAYNELVEEPLDNPWFRVILLNINKLHFSPFI